MTDFTTFGPWTIIAVVVLAQILLYAARARLRAAILAAARGVSGALRMVSVWARGTARQMREDTRQALMAEGEERLGARIERELCKVDEGITAALGRYPAQHRELEVCVGEIREDLRACQSPPPEVPGWADAIRPLASLPDSDERGARKVLANIKSFAVDAEKRALKEYRAATAKRHAVLARMAPHWQTVRKNMDGMLQAVTRALEAMRRVDGYVERCEQIRRGEPKAARALGGETLGQFLVASLVLVVAAGGAFVNFQLIALPMAELVPSTTRVAGTPVSSIAALVLVLTEMTAGFFVMEALGLTDMFPAVGRLSTRQRRIVLGVAFAGLFILACIESSLAILREQIVAADLELRNALAGAETGTVSESAFSSIPLVGQAVLGFVLPFLLALIALPLETVIASGRYVGARVIESVLFVLGAAARVLGRIVHYGGQMLAALLDVVIGVPLLIERLVSRRASSEDPTSSRSGRAGRDRSRHEIGLRRKEPELPSEGSGEEQRETPRRPRPGGAELPPRVVPAPTTPERAAS